MSRLEKIARDLAAVLSPEGEADWRSFLDMADEVGTRMFHQFAEILAPGSSGTRPAANPQASGIRHFRSDPPDRDGHSTGASLQ